MSNDRAPSIAKAEPVGPSSEPVEPLIDLNEAVFDLSEDQRDEFVKAEDLKDIKIKKLEEEFLRKKEIDEADAVLLLDAEVWQIRYYEEAGRYPVQGNLGIVRLKRILEAKRQLTVADMMIDPEMKLVADAMPRGQPVADVATIRNIKRQLDEIKDIRTETGGSDRLDAEEAALLDGLRGPSGKKMRSALSKNHHTIASQLRRLLKKLAKRMPKLAKHLTVSLELEYPFFTYNPPDPSPVWKF